MTFSLVANIVKIDTAAELSSFRAVLFYFENSSRQTSLAFLLSSQTPCATYTVYLSHAFMVLSWEGKLIRP